MIQALHNENVKRRKISMKKIGFIDNFLSEWHANNYPDMIRNNPRAKDSVSMCVMLMQRRKFPLMME